MASINPDSLTRDVLVGNVNFSTDTFKAQLHTSSMTPAKTMARRSDLTNEVSGTGYSTGGQTVTAAVGSTDTTNHKTSVTFSNPSWSNATITARYVSIYKSRGGAASADELVGIIDLGGDITSTNGTFAVTISTQFAITN